MISRNLGYDLQTYKCLLSTTIIYHESLFIYLQCNLGSGDLYHTLQLDTRIIEILGV